MERVFPLSKRAEIEPPMRNADRARRPQRIALVWTALLTTALYPKVAVAQQSGITIRTSTNLVLVDVVALKSGLPVKGLRRDDFELLDNDRPVSVTTFDSGAEFKTRPLALWFIVLCNMQGDFNETYGSGLFRGETHLLQPALVHMEKQDAVGVAHWCDDGQSNLDLRPTSKAEEAITALEQVLQPVPNTESHDRSGELALQRTMQLIIEATRSSKPEPLPVLIFLYGDHSGMPKTEANHFVDELLETSAIAFGIRDSRSHHMLFLLGEQKEVAHYITDQTGGQYLDASPETYAAALDEILQQLHFRYELGFQPSVLDGKRHKLTVRLSDSASRQYRGVRLRYRAAYVPVARERQQKQTSH
jgi:hypothetical protein